MRKIILSLHTTLDGFVAGPNGEMNWIKLDDTLFDHVGSITDTADTALYGKNTYRMMENYWPTAADKPNATKHDKEHSVWYNSVQKIVLSTTMKNESRPSTTFIGDNVPATIEALKNGPGKNIMIFGSPSAAHSLMQHNLIDEYWLFINPIVLGAGIPVFAKSKKMVLKHETTMEFPCGVTALHYTVVR